MKNLGTNLMKFAKMLYNIEKTIVEAISVFDKEPKNN